MQAADAQAVPSQQRSSYTLREAMRRLGSLGESFKLLYACPRLRRGGQAGATLPPTLITTPQALPDHTTGPARVSLPFLVLTHNAAYSSFSLTILFVCRRLVC